MAGELALQALFVLTGLMAPLAFYLATPHQRLVADLTQRAKPLRAIGGAGLALSLIAAVIAMGVWAGFFGALTAVMLGAVLWPYLDAARRQRTPRAENDHVG